MKSLFLFLNSFPLDSLLISRSNDVPYRSPSRGRIALALHFRNCASVTPGNKEITRSARLWLWLDLFTFRIHTVQTKQAEQRARNHRFPSSQPHIKTPSPFHQIPYLSAMSNTPSSPLKPHHINLPRHFLHKSIHCSHPNSLVCSQRAKGFTIRIVSALSILIPVSSNKIERVNDFGKIRSSRRDNTPV